MNNVGDYIELNDSTKCLIVGIRKPRIFDKGYYKVYSVKHGIIKIDISNYKLCRIYPKFFQNELASDELLREQLKVSQSIDNDKITQEFLNVWKTVIDIVNKERNTLNLEVVRQCLS